MTRNRPEFDPIPTKPRSNVLHIELGKDIHSRLKYAATHRGITMASLAAQAIDFALKHITEEPKK